MHLRHGGFECPSARMLYAMLGVTMGMFWLKMSLIQPTLSLIMMALMVAPAVRMMTPASWVMAMALVRTVDVG